jgi:Na+/H+-dicarboxylate symporter
VKLPTRILLGLLAGIAAGLTARASGASPLLRALVAIEPFGTMFIRLITMVMIPLVVATLFVGVGSLADIRRLGRIGGRTLAYFAGSTLLAALIGLVVALLGGVGRRLEPGTRDALTARFAEQASSARQAAEHAPGFVETLVNLIPANPIAAAAQGDLLPLIVAVCIFAAAATMGSDESRRALIGFFSGVNEIAMIVIRWLMVLAPPAVFVLIAATVARSGLDLLANLLLYSVLALVAMTLHAVLVLLPALRLGARRRLVPFVRAVSDALILAFSTASSSATLPVSLAAATNRLGISKDVASFVLPAGTTVNKNGAAVYKAVTAVFIAQLYGLDLGPAMLLTVLLASTVAAFAGAGVPGSSLVTTLIVLNAMGLGPRAAAGIALVAGVDRPLDMCRTTLNTLSNLIGASWVGRLEEDRGAAGRCVRAAGRRADDPAASHGRGPVTNRWSPSRGAGP